MGDAARLGGSAYHRGHAEWAETTVSVPDLPLPFDLALPDIERAFALTVLLGIMLGALAAHVGLTLRPFARRRLSGPVALLGLAALIVGCLVFGAFGDRGQTSLIVAAVAAALGALAYWWAHGKLEYGDRRGGSDVLSDDELRRDKTAADKWVLVAGPAGSGKSELVRAMVDVASLAGPVRSAEDGALRATEFHVRTGPRGVGTLRIWETPSIDGAGGPLPALSDFDGVVLTVDPVLHTPISDSFPDALRGGRHLDDANDRVLRLAEALGGGCTAWVVVTMADLLRFSVHPALIDLPLRPGPGWHEQVRQMDVTERRPLVEALGLGQLLLGHQAFEWGRSHPLFAYSGARRDPIGARDLLDAIRDALWPQ